MKMGGWWANTTTPSRKTPCTATNSNGTAGAASLASVCRGSAASSLRNHTDTPTAFTTTAIAAFQPNVLAIKLVSQPHWAATISTGGAANEVSVPPTEILTKSTPRVAYFRRVDRLREKKRLPKINAASVMAAGSVMKEPMSGTSTITTR